MMSDIAKLTIAAGLVLVAVGLLLAVMGKIPGLGKLPGDILIKKGDFTFYFPLATCMITSIAFSLILYFFFRK